MKFAQVSMMSHIVLLLTLVGSTLGAQMVAKEDKTITKVVKLLQGMLDKSKQDAEDERQLFAKFKCYCDDNEEMKEESVKNLKMAIGILESDIDGLQADNGALSAEVRKLDEDMLSNEQARVEAQSNRNKAHEDFVAEETDLTGAISQMNSALGELAVVGADQTMASAHDHKVHMRGFSGLNQLNAKVHQALVAASAFLSPKQASLLQGPGFTGNYASQSGQIVGILKEMRDTFGQNLDAARKQEETENVTHYAFMGAKLDSFTDMKKEYDAKQIDMGLKDTDLGTKRGQLTTAKNSLTSDQAFLDVLYPTCEAKAKSYEARKLMRAEEDASLAQAVAILDSDEAFATFGKVSATSTGATAGFLQVKQRHAPSLRSQAQRLLRNAALGQHSMKLSKVVSMLQAGNPFATVLAEIQKMLDLIKEEGDADDEKLSWCNSERTDSDTEISGLNFDIGQLNTAITNLLDDINNPVTGLKKQIQTTTTSINTNHNSMVTQTTNRKEDNVAYQKDIATLVQTENLLDRAIKVLKAYYEDSLGKANSATTAAPIAAPDPTETHAAAGHAAFSAPSTWSGDEATGFAGQSTKGNAAINMLEFIISETRAENIQAHTDEKIAQHSYEDNMKICKGNEKTYTENLASLENQLGGKEKTLEEKQSERAKALSQRKGEVNYLRKIKPGCDFITNNIALRDSHRLTEKNALTNAITLIKGTPAYLNAEATKHTASLGDCADICAPDEAHVECKACLAETSVGGYCAGHPGTTGCDTYLAPAPAR